MSSSERLSISDIAPGAHRAVLGLEKYVDSGNVDPALLTLVKIRASQINRCAWCLDMHTAEAREQGIEGRKIDVLAGWNEAADLYTDAERAALALTEQVTLVSENGVSDEVWDAVRASFDEQDTVTLVMAIAAINVWNRMNVAVRTALPPREDSA